MSLSYLLVISPTVPRGAPQAKCLFPHWQEGTVGSTTMEQCM